MDWEPLRQRRRLPRLPALRGRKKPSSALQRARAMLIVGEAPGENEDLQGEPLSARRQAAGQHVVRWPGSREGEPEQQVYIANT